MTLNKTVFAILASVFLAAQVHAAEIKVGVIDMQKAIQATSTGKKAKKDLEDEFNKKKKELEKREADIKKMGEDFEKRSMAMNEEARMKKQQEIQGQMRQYQEIAGKSQMEIQKREMELTKPIVEKLRSIIEDIAKKDDLTVVLERSEQSVMFAKKEVDITDRVLREYEASVKK